MKRIISTLIIITIAINFYSIELDLEKCKNMALRNSEEIQAKEKAIEMSQAKKNEIRTNFLPKLSFSATYLHKNDPLELELDEAYLPTFSPNTQTGELDPNLLINPETGDPIIGADGNPLFESYAYFPGMKFDLSLKEAFTAGLSLKQPLFMGGKIYNSYKISNYALEIKKLALKAEKENILFKTEKSYWKLVSVKEKLNLAKKYQAMLQELVRQLEDAVDVGLIHNNKLMQVQVELNAANLKVQKAEHGVELTKIALFRIIGLAWDENITTSETLPTITKFKDINTNLKNRIDYKMLEIQQKIFKKKTHLAMAEFLPEIGLQASYNKTQYELNSETKTDNDYTIIASFEFPIFKWGENYYKAKHAFSASEKNSIDFKRYQENMALQIKKLKFDLEDSSLRIEMAISSTKQAEENLRISENQYELEQITLTELMKAQTQWKDAFSELTNAKIDFKLAKLNYLKAIGKLL